MTVRSLRVDLPYRPEPDEHTATATATATGTPPETEPEPLPSTAPAALPIDTSGETTGSTATSPVPAPPTDCDGRAITAPEDAALNQARCDALQLAQLLYATLNQSRGTADILDIIDNDTRNLLTRYGVMQTTVTSVEYYSHAGTFICEGALAQPAGEPDPLPRTLLRIQQRQAEGQLPGMEPGTTWRSGYMRLARLGERPMLILPTQVEP